MVPVACSMQDDVERFPVPDVPLPPEAFRNQDDAVYANMARYNVRVLSEHFPLRPDMHIVDVGCSAGRLALPFLNFLDPAKGAAYIGFDVCRAPIEWATANITSRWPHFTFESIDVQNSLFNPLGRSTASIGRFPVPDSFADVVIVHAVFTHLLESAVSRYLEEIARVLAPNGHAYISAFLWNADAESAVAAGSSGWAFAHIEGSIRAQHSERPEIAIAIREDFLRAEIAKNHLELVTTYYGKWREGPQHAQDFVILRRLST